MNETSSANQSATWRLEVKKKYTKYILKEAIVKKIIYYMNLDITFNFRFSNIYTDVTCVISGIHLPIADSMPAVAHTSLLHFEVSNLNSLSSLLLCPRRSFVNISWITYNTHTKVYIVNKVALELRTCVSVRKKLGKDLKKI